MGFYIEFEDALNKAFEKLCIDLSTTKKDRITALVQKDVQKHQAHHKREMMQNA